MLAQTRPSIGHIRNFPAHTVFRVGHGKHSPAQSGLPIRNGQPDMARAVFPSANAQPAPAHSAIHCSHGRFGCVFTMIGDALFEAKTDCRGITKEDHGLRLRKNPTDRLSLKKPTDGRSLCRSLRYRARHRPLRGYSQRPVRRAPHRNSLNLSTDGFWTINFGHAKSRARLS